MVEEEVKKYNEFEDGSKHIEEFWVKHTLPKEVETLPYDVLTTEEQLIIDKVRRNEELSQEEIDLIKQTRKTYEEPLKKYDANNIIESNKILERTIATEQDLLDFVYGEHDMTIRMNLPFKTGTKMFTFTVKPLEDSRAVDFLEQHIDIFRDLSDEERKIYDKNNSGEALNPVEEKVLKHINEQIAQNQSRSQMENITKLLATQLEEPTSLDFDGKKQFWSNFPFLMRVQLYSKVMEKLGLTQSFNDELFPTE